MMHAADIPDDIGTLKAIILAADGREERHVERIAQLEKLLADFKRALFGARSEKVDPDQFELALEDIETAVERLQAADEADERQVVGKPRPRRANRGSLPKHLPRIEEVILPESTFCDCGSERHVTGEDVGERLDIIPAQFRVIHCPAGHCNAMSREGSHGAPNMPAAPARAASCRPRRRRI